MELIQILFSFAINHYWMGVIVGLVMIFCHLKINYTTDWECKFKKEYYLFLLLCFLSWLVPIFYLGWLVCFALYFIAYCVFTLFKVDNF